MTSNSFGQEKASSQEFKRNTIGIDWGYTHGLGLFYSRNYRKVIFDLGWMTNVSSRKAWTLDMTAKYMFGKKSNGFFLGTGLTYYSEIYGESKSNSDYVSALYLMANTGYRFLIKERIMIESYGNIGVDLFYNHTNQDGSKETGKGQYYFISGLGVKVGYNF